MFGVGPVDAERSAPHVVPPAWTHLLNGARSVTPAAEHQRPPRFLGTPYASAPLLDPGRTSAPRQVGALVLPSLISIDRVREKFDLDGTPLDESTEIKLRGLADTLLDYVREAICPKIVLEEMLRAEA